MQRCHGVVKEISCLLVLTCTLLYKANIFRQASQTSILFNHNCLQTPDIVQLQKVAESEEAS